MVKPEKFTGLKTVIRLHYFTKHSYSFPNRKKDNFVYTNKWPNKKKAEQDLLSSLIFNY